MEFKTLNVFVISYCDIPEEIIDTHPALKEVSCGVYYPLYVLSKKKKKKYSDDFTLTNWIIENFPELEGKSILIDIDY